MKHFILPAIALSALVSPAIQAATWGTDVPAALNKAAAEDKNVFVLFTGSDWCGPCIAMKKNVLSKPDFEAFADDNFILVELDFPRSPLPAKQAAHNKAQAEKYGVRGFPTVLILDKDGKELAKTVGGLASLDALKERLAPALSANTASDTSSDDNIAAEITEKIEALGEDYDAIYDYAVKTLEDEDLPKDAQLVLYTSYINASLYLVTTEEEIAELHSSIADDIIPYFEDDYPELMSQLKEVASGLTDEAQIKQLIEENTAE